jgi:hypothetical protein
MSIVSDCCGATEWLEDTGICGVCKEHADFEDDTLIIEKLKLTQEEVCKIVLEWYTNGMCKDIFQNENGEDLEEYLEDYL